MEIRADFVTLSEDNRNSLSSSHDPTHCRCLKQSHNIGREDTLGFRYLCEEPRNLFFPSHDLICTNRLSCLYDFGVIAKGCRISRFSLMLHLHRQCCWTAPTFSRMLKRSARSPLPASSTAGHSSHTFNASNTRQSVVRSVSTLHIHQGFSYSLVSGDVKGMDYICLTRIVFLIQPSAYLTMRLNKTPWVRF